MLCPICNTQLNDDAKVCWACGHGFSTSGRMRLQLDPGTMLQGGRYRIEKVLGQGGFGITYAATEMSLKQSVAIKELFPEGSGRHNGTLYPPASLEGDDGQGFRDVIDGFIEEARTVAKLRHPGIVQVYHVFEENQTAYMVMEYLEGETLSQRFAREGRLSPDAVLSLANDLAQTLDAIHSADLLHRDIKPDNIFLTSDGRTVLIDFGSARVFNQDKTVSHTRLITPGYAPPEQYATQARFGPYTDLYALSATLHHALSGQMPPPATDRMMGATLPFTPSRTPEALQHTLEASLAIRIEERPADVAAFRRLLEKPKRTHLTEERRQEIEKMFRAHQREKRKKEEENEKMMEEFWARQREKKEAFKNFKSIVWFCVFLDSICNFIFFIPFSNLFNFGFAFWGFSLSVFLSQDLVEGTKGCIIAVLTPLLWMMVPVYIVLRVIFPFGVL